MARSKSEQPELEGLGDTVAPQAVAQEAAVPVLPEGLTYDEAVRQLEGLVAQMESGQLPLEALLGAYRQSSALLGWCRDRLQGVEDQIKRFDSPGQAG